MKINTSFTGKTPECGIPSVVTLGTFDGVHTGHQRILECVARRAHEGNMRSVVVTFDRHPASVLGQDTSPGMISTLGEKLNLFADHGIDAAFVIEFTEEFSRLPADDFIRHHLSECLAMRHFVAGYDHGFGRGREISGERLREFADELGFRLEVMEPVVLDGIPVKSSGIRTMIGEGNVGTASRLLGRDYSIHGVVAHGAGIGAKIGFPTANLKPDDPGKIVPASGVYAGWALFGDDCIPGVINVGPRPTFNQPEDAIEIHLPGYSGDLYNRGIRIGFARRLRNTARFETQEALVRQIENDIESSRQFTVSCSREKEWNTRNGDQQRRKS